MSANLYPDAKFYPGVPVRLQAGAPPIPGFTPGKFYHVTDIDRLNGTAWLYLDDDDGDGVEIAAHYFEVVPLNVLAAPPRSCGTCVHETGPAPKCGLCAGPTASTTQYITTQSIPTNIPVSQPQPVKEITVNTYEIQAAQAAHAALVAKSDEHSAALTVSRQAIDAAKDAATAELQADISLAIATQQLLSAIRSRADQQPISVFGHAEQLEGLANKYGYTVTVAAGRAFLETISI